MSLLLTEDLSRDSLTFGPEALSGSFVGNGETLLTEGLSRVNLTFAPEALSGSFVGNGDIQIQTALEKPASQVCGDLNGDGDVNVFDAITNLQIIVGLIEPTETQLKLGDVVRDETIDVLDVTFTMQHIVGLTEITSCGPPVA